LIVSFQDGNSQCNSGKKECLAMIKEIRYSKNIATFAKTIEMTQYNVGATVPIVYLRSDPTQNKHTLASVLK